MNRSALMNFTHNAKGFLNVGNTLYKQWVFRYTFLELEKDLAAIGDITTHSLFKAQRDIVSNIVANEDGVLCGLEEIKYFLVDGDKTFRSKISGRFVIDSKFHDGDFVKKGDVMAEIKAELHDLLAVERTVLNLIGRMSGVATFTRKIVEKVKNDNVLITPTRKTLWGLLDKKAVSVGGGGTHRLNLGDAVLVKDNHLDLMKRDFDLMAERLSIMNPDCRFIEVEVDNQKEALVAAIALSKYKFNSVLVIMMDNMSASDVAKTVEEFKNEKFYDQFLLEASGGINENNVLDFAATGVDIISMGCLTDGVKRLDIGMEILR